VSEKKKNPLFDTSLTTYLYSYDERLGAIAIEIAEQTVSPASGQPILHNTTPSQGVNSSEEIKSVSYNTTPSQGVNPSEEIKSISYNKSPSFGSSVGLAGDQQSAGTLGAFLRIVTDSTPQYFALTSSHVLSCKCFLGTIVVSANIYSFQDTYYTWQQ
jgi:hypothetical protein